MPDFTPKKWDDASIPEAASFDPGDKLMGLVGATVTRFPQSVIEDAFEVVDATTTVKGKVELATDGEDAANVVVQGNDSRLDNARTPTVHASSHLDGGSDEIVTTDLGPRGSKYDPDRTPASINQGDEFVGGIGGSWTVFNNGGGLTWAASMDTAELSLSTPATGDHIRGQFLPTLPTGTDWVATAKIFPTISGSFNGVGMVLLATGTIATPTRLELLMVSSNGTVNAGKWDNYSAGGAVAEGSVNLPSNWLNAPHWVYLRMRYNTTTKVLTFEYSLTGMDWKFVGNPTLPSDPLNIGLGCDDNSSSAVPKIRAAWFRVRTDATGTTTPYPAGE